MTNNHVCLHLGKNNFKASQSQSHEEASSKPFFSTKWTFEKRMYFHPTRKDVSIFCDIVCYLVTFQTLPIYMLICFSSQVHSKIVRVGVAIKKYITNSLFSSILQETAKLNHDYNELITFIHRFQLAKSVMQQENLLPYFISINKKLKDVKRMVRRFVSICLCIYIAIF